MSHWKHLLGPLRLPFLILTPACIVLGAALAYQVDGGVDVHLFLMVLLGAVSAHISVNAFNEYADFRSGLDALTLRTPFSGGSGVLPAQPALAPATLAIAVAALLFTIAIGGYFLTIRGLGLLPLGIVGVVVVLTYTPWINRNPWLCLLAPGLGFGPLMVMGTVFVLSGRYSSAVFAASMVPFFLVNGLLLLNQFPDVEADRRVGRRNLPILFGRRVASRVYALLVLLAFASLVMAVVADLLPRASLIGLLGLVVAVPLVRGVYRNADHIGALLPYMALNVALTVITPVLVAAGVWLAA
jgi:1,4-dihydroxy-2-naphthoate polyprenyltransferase